MSSADWRPFWSQCVKPINMEGSVPESSPSQPDLLHVITGRVKPLPTHYLGESMPIFKTAVNDFCATESVHSLMIC